MIVLCAGGTGGHVFPAESLAEELKSRGHSLALITDSRAMNFVNYEVFEKIIVLNVSRSNPFVYFFSMIKAVFKALYFLILNKAKLVIGFGGYPSLPGMIAGQILFKKTLLHEQNAVLGRANRLLSFFSKGLAISFYPTKLANKKAVLIGNPVRKFVHDAIVSQKKITDKFELVVIGGSQGSRLFSEVVPKAIAMIDEKLREKIHVIQQCRAEDINDVREFYNSIKVSYKIETFFNDMPMHMRNADLAICRAGASTIAEITCLGLPAILIPLAISKDNDQGENARRILEHNGGMVIFERDFNSDNLSRKLEFLISNHNILSEMSNNIVTLGKPDAHKKMADWVESNLQIN